MAWEDRGNHNEAEQNERGEERVRETNTTPTRAKEGRGRESSDRLTNHGLTSPKGEATALIAGDDDGFKVRFNLEHQVVAVHILRMQVKRYWASNETSSRQFDEELQHQTTKAVLYRAFKNLRMRRIQTARPHS